MGVRPTASREVELDLAARHGIVAGIDEVGRGCLAGPVTVGVALVDEGVGAPPEGLTDSKALSARRREDLVEPVRRWVLDHELGWASAAEIDEIGVVAALRLAARRALAALVGRGRLPGVVLLDGSHDWLSLSQDLFTATDAPTLPGGPEVDALPVVTRVKADLECAVVSAASVLAKVARDDHMCALDDPGYGWASNKGYASAAHVEGLARLGPAGQHRRSWKLPGVA
ncbi:ribonuclease HII [Schaalia sp. 19OD2882]|uniref:ribonuclease HII n=1 Tax=Schaalia sp. 19OD2882 TaxID=2794089 RepID=UPI001C1EB918|nr:ribonuclease HII [Schaalia sp. 19OD2882]QWW18821.1 ribonuclease HII [Schaalia sp. 19OD2882]